MEISTICLCCLRGPADRDMKTPYLYFGKTEIYSDMLKECFEIHPTKLLTDGERGICEACVGRLRDAYDFKLQVLQKQAELQHLLDKEHVVKEEECSLKSELLENDEELIGEECSLKSELSENYEDLIGEECSLKSELSENYEDLIDFREDVKLEIPDPLPSAETTFKEFEAMMDTENQTSEVCKEPTIEYEFEQAIYLKSKEHSGIRYKCKACGEHFTNKGLLAIHKKTHNICPTCKKQFTVLKFHRCRPGYSCDLCNKEFRQRVEFDRHKRLVHFIEQDTQKLLTCDICDVQFRRKTILIAHIRKHQERKHVSCPHCPKKFFYYQGWYAHQKLHEGEIYNCICGKTFTSIQSLKDHKKKHGSYPCNVCKKQFRTLQLFRRHQVIHTDVRPYSCECGKSFRHKHILENHMLIHTGARPYCCEVCGKRFSKRCNLKTHQLTHVKGNYSCEFCTKSYSTKESLRQHSRTHKKKKVKLGRIKRKVKKSKSKIKKNTD